MKDVQEFVAIYGRLHGAPPDMELPLQEVWKQLQAFSLQDPLSFYELALVISLPKLRYVPAATWRDRITGRGLASLGLERGNKVFEPHDLVSELFARYLLPPPPVIVQEPMGVVRHLDRSKARSKRKNKK